VDVLVDVEVLVELVVVEEVEELDVVVVVGRGAIVISIQFAQYNDVEHTFIVVVPLGTSVLRYPAKRSTFVTPTSNGVPKESRFEYRLKGPVSVPAVVS
jgi:hypothetical protein